MSRGPSRREVTAAETRTAILNAALQLFTTRGYGATAITDIAAAAGVAIPTIYSSVGRKPDLLRATLDRIDEIAEIPALARTIATGTEPRQVLATAVHITRLLAERCGDVQSAVASAATVEPEMAQVYRGGMQRHRAGAEATVTRLEELRALKSGLDHATAVAVLATLTGHRTWESLLRDHGWSLDLAENWLTTTLARELLAG